MPTYEMPLLIRLGKKAEYANILKTVSETIFNSGGFIRTIENWGEKDLPCKTSSHGQVHRKAGHFLMSFDVPPSSTLKILDECQRNWSIVRVQIYLRNEPSKKVECTLEDDMLPAPYRPTVKKMLETAAKQKSKNKEQFKYNSGLDYYPFLK